MSTKYIRILPRIDTLKNWKTNNPILRENELCIVIIKRDRCKWKIGDGKTPFKKLKYVRNLKTIQTMLCYASIPETKYSDNDIHHLIAVIDISQNDLEAKQKISVNSNYDDDTKYYEK